ncbi:hypothetical protein N7448_011027 [Penicillium atrosanguineum]|nr:hypothetical protein N7448_011027 [Penicillium atrosanguineum]
MLGERIVLMRRSGAPSYEGAKYFERNSPAVELSQRSMPLMRIMCAVAGVVRIRRRNFREKDEQAMIH